MAIVLRQVVIGKFGVVLSLLHYVDLPVQTLVVNLGDMLFLGLLDDPPNIVHVASF